MSRRRAILLCTTISVAFGTFMGLLAAAVGGGLWGSIAFGASMTLIATAAEGAL